MRADVLPYLSCPVCRQGMMADHPGSIRCPRGHAFDVARQGYTNLTTGRTTHTGDSADMVAARAEFLGSGHYDFIAAALAEAARSAYPEKVVGGDGLVLDAGAGTGWYLAAVLDALPGAAGLALDVSKPALRRAARAHPRASAALADTWGRLPLADGAVALLLNVFAPRNGAEFHRVLAPDGALLVVTPADDHLTELVAALELLRVDPGKPDRVAAGLHRWFLPVEEATHRRTLRLDRTALRALVAMGPSAWHVDAASLAGALPDRLAVTAAIRLAVYRPA